MLKHKVTSRPWYKEAAEKIKNGRIFDEIYFNSRGELTEGSRTNVFILKNNVLYTPPVECGLLPGTLRQVLLKHKKCCEKIMFKNDVLSADKIFCGNSVRGLVEVQLKHIAE